jgi:hypothetical protein
MKRKFPDMLEGAGDLPDIFEVVKKAVRQGLKRSRGGLMLGLADLGNNPAGYFGGFFYVGSNVIVLNRVPLHRIMETKPKLYKPYVFHVLLHEYLHTLDYLDEGVVRGLAYDISLELFGEEHLTTRIARDTSRFFPNLVYPDMGWQPKDMDMELVQGFDRSSVNYIA